MVVGMWSAEVQSVPQRQTALIQYADGLSRAVRGMVVRVRMLPPRASGDRTSADEDSDKTEWHEAEAPGAMSVDVAVEAIEEGTPDVSRMGPMTGGVRVAGIGHGDEVPPLKGGDGVEGPLRLRSPERERGP